MTQRTTLFMVLVLTALIAGCRSSQENIKDTSTQTLPRQPGPGVPPSHCRIVGTVVAIDQQRTGNPDDVCSRAPCTATVKLEKILGYGSGFTEVLGEGKEIKVRFRYTLSPTGELFPQMTPRLPGLEIGTKFQTDLLMAGPSIAGNEEPRFLVEQYERK